MVDPRITQAFEDGRVTEEGITPEFLAESKDQPAIIAIIFVTALTFLIVCGRLLSRIFIVKRFGIDDALALSGLVSIHTVMITSGLVIKLAVLIHCAIDLSNRICRPLHNTHRLGFGSTFCLYPICTRRSDYIAHAGARLCRAHHLHIRTAALPRVWFSVLLSTLQPA